MLARRTRLFATPKLERPITSSMRNALFWSTGRREPISPARLHRGSRGQVAGHLPGTVTENSNGSSGALVRVKNFSMRVDPRMYTSRTDKPAERIKPQSVVRRRPPGDNQCGSPPPEVVAGSRDRCGDVSMALHTEPSAVAAGCRFPPSRDQENRTYGAAPAQSEGSTQVTRQPYPGGRRCSERLQPVGATLLVWPPIDFYGQTRRPAKPS